MSEERRLIEVASLGGWGFVLLDDGSVRVSTPYVACLEGNLETVIGRDDWSELVNLVTVVHVTKTGSIVTEKMLDDLADEAERGYDVDRLHGRVDGDADLDPSHDPASETIHVFLTDYGRFGWGISSPQLPELVGGRATAAELTAELDELLEFGGARPGADRVVHVRRYDETGGDDDSTQVPAREE